MAQQPGKDPPRSRENPTRRGLLRQAAVAGTALAVGFPAPAILAQTRKPIRLGILNSFTGAQAYNANDNVNGMSLYFDRIGWSIAGRPVEMIKEDDQFNAQIGLEKTKKFVESDHVDMIVGPQASNVAMALLNFVKQTKSFLVVSGAGSDQITWERIPYLFRTTITTWQLCTPMGQWVYDNVAKNVVATGTDYIAGRDTIREFAIAFQAKGGKIASEIYPPLGTTDFSVYLTQIAASGAGASFNFYTAADSVRFIDQYSELGLKDRVRLTGFSALIDGNTLAAVGRAALGVVTPQIYTTALDTPVNRAFVAAYRDKYHGSPTTFSDYGYVTAQVIDEAIKATDGDTSDKDKLAAAMVKVAFDAPRGPFRFDPVTHHPIQNVYMCEVREIDGQLVIKDFATIKDVRDPGVKNF
jgi:branched-chain amino acid transport system substrate-binding protein